MNTPVTAVEANIAYLMAESQKPYRETDFDRVLLVINATRKALRDSGDATAEAFMALAPELRVDALVTILNAMEGPALRPKEGEASVKKNYEVRVQAVAMVVVEGVESEEEALDVADGELSKGDFQVTESEVERELKTPEELASAKQDADCVTAPEE